MGKPGQPLPDAFGLLPTLEQVAASPPPRSVRHTRRQLNGFGGQKRNARGYPKKQSEHSRTTHIFRHEWETARPLHTMSVTNALRRAGFEPQPD